MIRIEQFWNLIPCGALAVGVLSGVGSREELKGMADILIPSVDVLDQLEAIYTGKTTEWKAIYR